MSIEFHSTVMGRRFYEHTVPDLVLELRRIGDALRDIAESMKETNPKPREVEQ